ncbi:MAG: formylglycine-generating enzyme family protein [Treponema sp.]|jgi:formylglycine-generating enzyme required for sulfatase activity|nr:formylglycine-generating enzyme family protein [Treponema sp.]
MWIKRFFIITLAALWAMAVRPVHGQQAQPKLVVPPFEKRGTNLEPAELGNLQDYLINAFINTRRFQVPDRNALALLAEEHQFQLDDWADEEKSAEMGKVLNANYIVRVIVMHDGEANLLMARILDVKTAGGVSAAEIEFTTQRDARGKMADFVKGILQGIEGGEGQPAPKGFVLVEGGTFIRGSPDTEPDRQSREGPQHGVTVKSFYMARYEVTQKEWREVMGTTVAQQRDTAQQAKNESGWKLYGEGDSYPMYYVNWYEAVEYCNKRSVKEGLTPAYRGSGNSITCDWNATGYRLPTDAEWEYAAKGGNRNYITYLYAGSNSPGAVAWYRGNSGNTTHPVGTKAPNSLGIYDLSGNVHEWCWDWSEAYGAGVQTDPRGAVSGSTRRVRGGSWGNVAGDLRSPAWYANNPSDRNNGLGFRLVRSQ